MKRYEQDMTQGNLWKQMWAYGIPLMLTNLLQVLFSFADAAVVGRFGEPGALGSVGSTAHLISLFTGVVIGLSGGANVLVAQARGGKDSEKTKEAVHTSAVIMLLAGILIAFLAIVFARPLLVAMNTKPELLDNAVLYFRVYFSGMPALALYNFGKSVLNSVGDTKRPLYFLLLAGAINLGLNVVFVTLFHMNVLGVALATVISQVVSAVLVLRVLLKSKEDYALHIKELSINKDIAKSILRIGIPSAGQYVVFQVANVFIQRGVNSFDAIMVEGTSIAGNAENLTYNMSSAFYAAIATFIGQNLGAKKKDRILKSYLIGQFSAMMLSLTLGAGMYRLTMMGLSCWICTLMDGAIAASRGLGKTLAPMIIVIFGSCVFRIIWVHTVFAYFGTITSLYLVFVCSWSITAIIEIIYFFRTYRKVSC